MIVPYWGIRSQLAIFMGLLMLAVAGASTALAATTGENVLKIGAAISRSGSFSNEGKDIYDGYEMWRKLVSGRGGINVGGKRYKVEIVYYDDKSDAQTAAELVQKLIVEDKVKFIFGPFSSGITNAVSAMTDRHGVMMMASSANSDALYNMGRRYLFMPGSTASVSFHNFIRMAKELGPSLKTVAIATPDNLAALGWADGAKAFAEANGLTVIMYEKYPITSKDLSTIATKMRMRQPDIVIATGFIEDTILLARQMKDLGVRPKLMGVASPAASAQFMNALGNASEGIYAVQELMTSLDLKDPVYGSMKEWLGLLKQQGASVPHDRHAAASVTAEMLQLAIEKAGTIDDVAKVRSALLSLDVETVWGQVRFDPKGFNAARTPMVVQMLDKKIVPVYPKRVAGNKTPVYPKQVLAN